MANFIMKDWRVTDKTPYVSLGSAGENNATAITIRVDDIILNAEYFLDIGDESGNGLPNTQQLIANIKTASNGEEIKVLSLSPLSSFLGKEGVKLLQVRCVYKRNGEQVVKESNVFHARVDKNSGFVYKYNMAIFEQYLEQMRQLFNCNGAIIIPPSDKPNPSTGVVVDGAEKIKIVNIDINACQDATVTLQPTKYYRIANGSDDAVAELNILLDESDISQEYQTPSYHFGFQSGSQSTQLCLPLSVIVADSFEIKPNVYYDITINPYTHILTYESTNTRG